MVKPHPKNWFDIDRRRFDRKLRKLVSRSQDMSPAFHTIGKMFRQSRKTIFKIKGPGGYEDLKPATKKRKIADPNSKAKPYPILKFTGALERSLINVGDKHNVNIVMRKSFAFGTNLWYAKFHNSQKKSKHGKRRMPLRMFVFWGPEAPRTMRNRTDATKRFGDRAIKVLKNYLIREAKNA